MREPADRAVAACRGLEVEMGEGVRLRAAGRDAELAQQVLAHEVRRPVGIDAGADVRLRLPVIPRQELRVAVGEVEQARVAELRDVVQGGVLAARVERHPGGRSGREQPQELPAGDGHRLTC
jgi:hypothetical protein